MDDDSVKRLIMATCSTLYKQRNEAFGSMMPASTLYMALGMDIHGYEIVSEMMRGVGLVTLTAETITLTEKGLELGRKINESRKDVYEAAKKAGFISKKDEEDLN